MNFSTQEQRLDFERARTRIMADLSRMNEADHETVGRQIADIANALNILQLVWNEVADGQ